MCVHIDNPRSPARGWEPARPDAPYRLVLAIATAILARNACSDGQAISQADRPGPPLAWWKVADLCPCPCP